MKVYVFVEGDADKRGLEALWQRWRQQLRPQGIGIEVIPLRNKDQFLKRIGDRAAEILFGDPNDVVVGLPDLHPVARYVGTSYAHKNVQELSEVQKREVERALRNIYSVTNSGLATHMHRFHGTALKHDLEMLLLASADALAQVLRPAPVNRDHWIHPVEDQNLQRPPKRIIEELFLNRSRRRRAYREKRHAAEVLGRVTDIRSILINSNGLLECPVFKEMLDWIGEKTGVAAYE